jgi:hypothetical protein
MIYLSCLLAAIGLADIVRARSPRPALLIIASALGVALTVGLHWLVGVNVVVLVVSGGVLVAWVVGTSHSSFGIRKIAVGMLGAVTLAGIALSGSTIAAAPTGPNPAQSWFASLTYPALETVSFGQALAVASLAVFLIESANVIVRTVLELPDDEDAPRTTRGKLGARRPAPAPLKGGRVIGPLERIFLFALALAGQFTAIGAIVAAKGIVRFPEISRDNNRGSNAELFLVGSFTSWALVLVAVLLARLSA